MEGLQLAGERDHRTTGMLISIIIHLLLLLILLANLFHLDQVESGSSGIVIAMENVPSQTALLSDPAEEAQENESAENRTEETSPAPEQATSPPVNETTDLEALQEESPVVAEKKADLPVSTPEEPEASPAIKSVPVSEAENSSSESEIEVQEQERTEKAAEEARQREAAAEAKRAEEERRLEAERQRQEEERRAEEAAQEKKSSFGNLLSKGKENEGDEAAENGQGALEGLAEGSGEIGGGLRGRGIVFEPKISENSQYTGTVVVAICVDRSGSVVSGNYQLRGSTTNNSTLISAAKKAALKYRFEESDTERQCGEIRVDFRVR